MVPLIEPIAGLPSSPQRLRAKALEALSTLPPFSPILNRLLASLAGDDVSFAKLGDLIEKDTVLAGNLLHLVNSALYARRGTINSVRHATSLLGIDKLRNAVLGMSLSRMWKQIKMPSSWSMARFNMHSAATAILSDLLAQRLPVNYPEGAYVAGLLHDVGRLLIAAGLPQKHDDILGLNKGGQRSLLDCEQEVLGFMHPELSAEAMVFWNLPESIRVAVLNHHSSASDQSTLKPGEIPLSRVLQASNQYVNSMGVSIQPGIVEDSADATLAESVELDRDRLEMVLAEFQADYAGMVQFFH